MYDYQVYTLWLVIPTVVAFVLFYAFSITLCQYVKGVKDSTLQVLDLLIGDTIKEIQPVLIYAAFQLVGCALMTFWYEFLVDLSYSCDPDLDCYPFPIGFTTAVTWSIPPIENCSDYDILPDNMTIICFTFSLDYAGAIGEALGVFTFAGLGIRFMTEIVKWIQKKVGAKCGYILMLSLGISYLTVTIVVYFLGTLVPVLRPLVVGPSKQVQYFVYSLTFLVGFVVVPTAYLFFSNDDDSDGSRGDPGV